MEAAGAGLEINIASLGVTFPGFNAGPKAGAAVDALFPVKLRHAAVFAWGNCLTGANFNTCFSRAFLT